MRMIARVLGPALAVALVLPSTPSPAAAASGHPILYVDGKHGSDNAVGVTWSADWGRSPEKPFKTVERALEETKHGSPTAIRIRGYADYTYRESITRGYRMGSQSTPVVISSYTSAELPDGPLIRPIIDGGKSVGSTGWTRPWPSTHSHVWCKTWMPGANLVTGQKCRPATTPSTTRRTKTGCISTDPSRSTGLRGSRPSRSSTPSRTPRSWDGRSRPTISACGWVSGPATRSTRTPRDTTSSCRGTSGSSWPAARRTYTVRELEIRHTIMGVGLSVSSSKSVGKAHHNSIVNVDASYNYRMGFWTAGDYNVFDHISGSRNSIQLIKLDSGKYSDGTSYGARHNVIRDSTSSQNLGHGIKLYGKQARYNQAYGNVIKAAGIPAKAKAAGGATKGIQVSNGASYNSFWRNLLTWPRRGDQALPVRRQWRALNSNTFHHNRIEKSWTGVFLWDRKVSST